MIEIYDVQALSADSFGFDIVHTKKPNKRQIIWQKNAR